MPVPRLRTTLSVVVAALVAVPLTAGPPAPSPAAAAVGIGSGSSVQSATVVQAAAAGVRVATAKTQPFRTAPVPTLKGHVRAGATITLTAGTWSPAATLSYRWQRNGKTISGATGRSYTLTAADIGARITASVTGSASGRTTTTRTSAATVAAGAQHFGTAGAPTISGTTRSGSVLTARPGGWSPAPGGVAYRWLRDGTAIPKATGTSYRLTAADIGRRITVETTATRQHFRTTTTRSAATPAITPTRFTAAPVPTVSGTARVGSTLTAKAGTWTPSPTLGYQWLRNGAAIPKATTASYTASAADVSARLSVRVTASRSGHETTSSTSAAGSPVAALTFASPPTPTVSGSAAVRSKLTAKAGSWPSSPSLGYQWLRGGSAIRGATSASYTLTRADRAATITVRVTATKPGYTTASRASAGVAVPSGVQSQMAYLTKHWNNYNTGTWGNLNSIGGDCANFVSQGLIARGWEMTPEWYSRNRSATRSSSWGYVPAMDAWLAKNAKKTGAVRLSSSQRNKLKVGDIGMFDWNGNGVPDHTMTVSKVTTVNGKRKVYFVGHNVDNRYRDLDYVSPSWPRTAVWFWSLPPE